MYLDPNNKEFFLPYQATVSPLLTQETDSDPELFCDSGEFSSPVKDCGGRDFCECIHVLRVELGAIVEVSVTECVKHTFFFLALTKIVVLFR